MKFIPLIWSGIWRKRARTTLTVLQICIAFALFGVLQGMKTGVDRAIANARGDLLIVHSRVSMADPLPLAYLDELKRIAGVKLVDVVDFFLATYQRESQPVGVMAVIPENGWVGAYPDFKIAPEQLEAFAKTRTGALVSRSLAHKYNWKVGDHIPLLSNTLQADGSRTWAFDLVGIFSAHEDFFADDLVAIINYPYFDEARYSGRGTVKHFNVVVSDPRQALSVAEAIDNRFANSTNETRTESLHELAQSQMRSLGNLNFVVRAVITAVFLALLFSTATMMMHSLRERAPELAVLKTLGFTNAGVFIIVLTEAAVVYMTAALLGLCIAWIAFPFASKFVPALAMPKTVVEAALLLSVLFAVLSVAWPAYRAARLQIAVVLAWR